MVPAFDSVEENPRNPDEQYFHLVLSTCTVREFVFFFSECLLLFLILVHFGSGMKKAPGTVARGCGGGGVTPIYKLNGVCAAVRVCFTKPFSLG